MTWSIEHELEDGILIIRVIGDTGTQEKAEAFADLGDALLRELNPKKLLVDLTENHARIGPAGVFFLSRRDSPAGNLRKAAILDLRENEEYLAFVLPAYRNAGKFYRAFFDRDEAMSWLRKDD